MSKAPDDVLQKHRLICGDCLEWLDSQPGRSVDVVVTSPPYNIDLAYQTYSDAKTDDDYLAWMVKVAIALRRVMQTDASFFLNLSGTGSRPWLPFELIVRLRPFFTLQNHIVWVKSVSVGDAASGHFKPVGGQRFLHHQHEHIFHLTLNGQVKLDRLAIGVPFKDKSNIARRGHSGDLRCRGNTWFIPYETVQSKDAKFRHPGTFPLDLPLWCIRLAGKPRPVVLDPFMGTGTTLVAAAIAGGIGIGIDIDPQYVEVARQRLLCSEVTTPA